MRASSYLDDLIPNVTVPEGTSGEWRVERKTIEEPSRLDKLRAAMNGGGRYVPAGTYTGLKRGPVLVMSDTPDEKRDHLEFVRQATGHVLINGLGIGMVLQAVLLKPDVTAVTVVELSEDVIKLVGGHYTDPRLSIVHASAYDYQPPKGVRYGAVWHDIWDTISEENLDGMKKLHRKYGRLADWQGSWARPIIERQRKEDRRYRW